MLESDGVLYDKNIIFPSVSMQLYTNYSKKGNSSQINVWKMEATSEFIKEKWFRYVNDIP